MRLALYMCVYSTRGGDDDDDFSFTIIMVVENGSGEWDKVNCLCKRFSVALFACVDRILVVAAKMVGARNCYLNEIRIDSSSEYFDVFICSTEVIAFAHVW